MSNLVALGLPSIPFWVDGPVEYEIVLTHAGWDASHILAFLQGVLVMPCHYSVLHLQIVKA